MILEPARQPALWHASCPFVPVVAVGRRVPGHTVHSNCDKEGFAVYDQTYFRDRRRG